MTIYLDSKRIVKLSTEIIYNINNADTQQETRSGSTTSNGVQILASNSGIGVLINKIMFPMKKAGTPPSTFKYEIYNDAGTLQVGTETKSADSLTTSFVDTILTLTAPHTIVVGDRIVVTYASGDTSNKVLVSEDNSVGTIPTNTTHTAYNSGWTQSTSQWSNAKFYSDGAKPTNVQDNSILVEKDTGNRYWFSPSTSTSSQTSTDDAKSLKAGNRNKVGQQFNTGHSLVGSSPTKATFYLSKGGTPPNNVTAHIRNSSGTLRENSTTTIVADNLTGSAVATDFTFAGTTTLATGDMITVEYNSGDSSNYVNAWIDTSSAVTNSVLREYTSSWSDVSGQALKFDIESTTATWGKNLPTPTYETTYPISTGWTQVNTASSYWAIASTTQQFQNRIANSGSGASYDLGLLDSYDEWLLRFEFTADSSMEVQYNGDAVTVFGIQGRTDNAGTAGGSGGSYGTARAQVQMQIVTANGTRNFQAKAASDTTIGQSSAALNSAYTNNTKYYIEVKKTGATSYTIGVGTNSDYTTGRTEGNITATLTGLRYLHFESWGQNASYESRNGGIIENLKFYAGVSS